MSTSREGSSPIPAHNGHNGPCDPLARKPQDHEARVPENRVGPTRLVRERCAHLIMHSCCRAIIHRLSRKTHPMKCPVKAGQLQRLLRHARTPHYARLQMTQVMMRKSNRTAHLGRLGWRGLSRDVIAGRRVRRGAGPVRVTWPGRSLPADCYAPAR
jgi:hypothetical protein